MHNDNGMLNTMTPDDNITKSVQVISSNLGLGNGAYKVLRVGTNTVMLNTVDSIVARIHADDGFGTDLTTLMSILKALAAKGAPLLPPITEPALLHDGRMVTFWPQGDTSVPATMPKLAQLVALCHATAPEKGMRVWNVNTYNDQVAIRLERAAKSGAPDWAITRIKNRWESASQVLKQQIKLLGENDYVVLHDDPQPMNTARLDNKWLLLDCDGVCIGPAEYDLAQMMIHALRMDKSVDSPEVMMNYQDSAKRKARPIDMHMLDAFIDARTLKRCSWVAALWGSRADARTEFLHMVKHLDNPDVLWGVM